MPDMAHKCDLYLTQNIGQDQFILLQNMFARNTHETLNL